MKRFCDEGMGFNRKPEHFQPKGIVSASDNAAKTKVWMLQGRNPRKSRLARTDEPQVGNYFWADGIGARSGSFCRSGTGQVFLNKNASVQIFQAASRAALSVGIVTTEFNGVKIKYFLINFDIHDADRLSIRAIGSS